MRSGSVSDHRWIAHACGAGQPKRRSAQDCASLSPKALDIPVFDYAKIGAEREADRLGNVEVIYHGPERADELKQKEILESFIAQKVDGIAISVLNADFLTSTIDRAIDAGIPVVTWDSDAPKSKRRLLRRRRLQVRPDHGRGSRASVERQGHDRVPHERGREQPSARLDGGESTRARSSHQGFSRRHLRHPGRQRQCAQFIATGTNRYPNLGAWISVGGWPVFTANALTPWIRRRRSSSPSTRIRPRPICSRPAKCRCCSARSPSAGAAESVRLLHEIVNGKRPATPIIDSGVDVVTADNVDAYMAMWAKMERGES